MKMIAVLFLFVPLIGQDLPESPRRNRVKRPEAKVLERAIPQELRAKPRDEEREGSDPKRRVRRRSDDNTETRDLGNSRFPTRRSNDRVFDEAEKAAVWVAETQVYPDGFREYFQVGYYFGLNEALNDNSLGQWDFEQGEFDGQNDPAARNDGREIGKSMAYQQAEVEARQIVENQFSNLNWTPRMEIPRTRGSFPGIKEQYLSDNWSTDPFFRRYPPNQYAQFPKEIGSWRPDIDRLRRCNQYTDFYATPWTNLQRYFDALIHDRRNGAYYRNLNQAEKATFKQVFMDLIMERVWNYESDWEKRAYPAGLRSGWQYGSMIQYELQYQRGYEQGKMKAQEFGARSSFERHFPLALENSYKDEFNWWQSNPVLRTQQLELRENVEDGILEPGEEVELVARVENLGGARGRNTMDLRWNTLGDLPGQTIVVSPRSAVSLSFGTIRLPQRVALPYRLEISSSINGESWPFFFDMEQAVTLRLADIDFMAQNPSQVSISLNLSNQSSRSKSVRWMIGTKGGTLDIPPRANAAARSVVEVEDPFYLMSGFFKSEISADWGTGYISKVETIPESASNLNSEAIFELTEKLLQNRFDTKPDWFLQCWNKRLLADWIRADDQRGNPYKDDYKEKTERTELGKLVNRVRSLRNPDSYWVNMLQDSIEEWADDFPGAHPFLRKYVRRLAKELD